MLPLEGRVAMTAGERWVARAALAAVALPLALWLSPPRRVDRAVFAASRFHTPSRGEPAVQPTDLLPRTPSRADLVAAFRAHAPTRCDRYDNEIYAIRCIELLALRAGYPPAIETTWVLGLGMPAADVEVRALPTKADFAEVGLAEVAFDGWVRAARQLGVSRVDRWGVFIQDGYHGQPGLVVRQDIALRVAGGWEVYLDTPSPLVRDHRPVPPEPMACARVGTRKGANAVWRCKPPLRR